MAASYVQQPPTMRSKSSVILFFCLSLIGVRASFSPFQLVDEYVEEFQEGLGRFTEKFKSTLHRDPVQEYDPTKHNETQAIMDAEEFDFIIIGSGAAGSALANRLSEVPEWRVLLLEAGSAETTITQVPSMQSYLRTSLYNWEYKTVQQNTSCLGMENHQCVIGNGRSLGGETATNDMVFTRGHPYDYDLWSDTGLIGWCWESVEPYFKKLEDNYAQHLDRKEHHYGGPVHIENYQYSSPYAEHILKGAHEIGIKTIDYNGKERLGMGVPQVTTKDGKRNSAAQVYLATAYRRKNLVIRPNSRVIKVIVSPHTKEATGVKYLFEDHLLIAKASKEIILSAGAINTPQLLLLSGIGPKEDLEHLDIPVMSDLKVGHNLYDHLSFPGVNFIFNSSNDIAAESQEDVVSYLRYGKGPLTSNGIELIGFLKTEKSRSKKDWPDVELIIRRNIYNEARNHREASLMTQAVYDSVWEPVEDQECFTIEVVLLHPKSKGYLKLHNSDPRNYPLVNPNYLSDIDDEDIETILAGFHKALELVESEALQHVGIHVNYHKVPGCEHTELNDEYWKCAIRHLSTSLRHISGTTKMGPETDKEAVVDKDLRVYGVHNLRVADASVIPVSISGTLMGPEYMIGEQAAEIIKTEWIGKKKCIER